MDILVTRRLTLRPPLDLDAEAICDALQNTNVTRMLTAVPQPYGLSDANKWITKRQSRPNEPCFAIYRQNLMGIVSIESKGGLSADLGYWLQEPYWGNGYITEAARAVLSHGFRTQGYQHVTSGAFEDNPASLRVLEKLGFEFNTSEAYFNPTRNCDVQCKRAVLTRERFETLFGALETSEAA